MSTRFRRIDWLELGLRCLADDGPEGLKLAKLCERSKRTRGSFYHHFEDMHDFVTALSKHWQLKHTETLIEKTRHGTAQSRLLGLNKLAAQLNPGVESGMRQLASTHQTVQHVLTEVDDRRIAYLESLWITSKRVNRQRAAQLARLEYAAFVGGHTLWPKIRTKDAATLAGVLSEALWTLVEA